MKGKGPVLPALFQERKRTMNAKGYWLDRPANDWEMTLPIGNGRLGASVWGNIENERITINEESMWYGADHSRRNSQSHEYVGRIRELLLKGEVEKAQFLCQMAMTGTPKYIRPYQMACDMNFLFFHSPKSAGAGERVKNYRRELDLENAVTRVSYELDGTRYEREYFVSSRYQVLAMRLTAEGADRIRFQFNINRRPFERRSGGNGTDAIFLSGQCGDGVKYYSAATVGETDGSVVQIGDYLGVEDASDVVVYFDCETDFTGKNPEEVCLSRLRTAAQTGYEKLKEDHIRDYGELHGRMEFRLSCGDYSAFPMTELLKRTSEPDVRRYLIQLVFDFGRYLLIGSSYQCELPANLQGIWCGSYTPRWESKYTININIQMNYWMVDSCGLSECFAPYVKHVRRMVEKGRDTAESVYGCRGSVGHHNTDCYGNTDIEGLPASAYMWPMGLLWLSLELYDHYLYTQDQTFLVETVMPVLRESVLFFHDYLYRDESGEWLTGPSVSPENTYETEDGQTASITMAPTMDNELLWELCQDYLAGQKEAAGNGEYEETASMAKEILEHLPPIRLTADGRIREWREDYWETEKGHRHLSHLYALYPGYQINQDTPEFLEAARRSLTVRLENASGHIGWSRAWLICLYARLWDRKAVGEGIEKYLSGSVLGNLYNSHPPFQIDGNFGICAGVVEAIAQCRDGKIVLLPAVPDEWSEGSIREMRLRGGILLDMEWKKGEVHFCLTSIADQTVDVSFGKEHRKIVLKGGQPKEGTFSI